MQSTAETLAGLILVNVFAPGYPVIFSNWPLVIDFTVGCILRRGRGKQYPQCGGGAGVELDGSALGRRVFNGGREGR